MMKNKIMLSILILFVCIACSKDEQIQNELGTDATANRSKPEKDKSKLCHFDAGTGLWSVISINYTAVNEHLKHGDLLLIDTDGDGYVEAINECVPGGDCNDNDATVNPGMPELCVDGIDNNCNGTIDEDCDIITIGTQTWTSRNLDVDRYSDGTEIPEVTDPIEWDNLTTGAWCYYNNDSDNGTTYGKLYNWYAVAGIWDEDSKTDVSKRKKLAPTGWHIPSHAEWSTLTSHLGGVTIAGGEMKETGTAHWISTNIDVTNSSGFTGLPGGSRLFFATFDYIGKEGSWWSSSDTEIATAGACRLFNDNSTAEIWSYDKTRGLSARCLRD